MARDTNRLHDVERLRREHPVAEVMARCGIELRLVGRALVGRCPFHADGGRPNLHVYPETQRWFCYRCSIGGDAIEFIRRYEHLGFVEACDRLTGLPPHPPPRFPERLQHERRWDRLTLEEQAVMNTACARYQQALWREPRAREYLRGRAIPDWVIRRCALGYVDGHALAASVQCHPRLETALELGLLRQRQARQDAHSLTEFFTGRIVVPEIRGGNCLWFIGRDLHAGTNRLKYLTLPGERPVLGFERALRRRAVFLVEGVFDYLTAVSWKLPAVSPCGTHLPSDRLGFLARTEVIYGVLDGDEAGQAAAERFRQQLGHRFHPLPLPAGCDLNDLARHPHGRREFLRLLAAARRPRCKGGSDER